MADDKTPQTETPSPLAEAEAYSLEELFSRDPLEMTEEDLRKIVTEMRARRHLWHTVEMEAAAKGTRPNTRKIPKPKATKEEVKAALASLDIDSLDLDL